MSQISTVYTGVKKMIIGGDHARFKLIGFHLQHGDYCAIVPRAAVPELFAGVNPAQKLWLRGGHYDPTTMTAGWLQFVSIHYNWKLPTADGYWVPSDRTIYERYPLLTMQELYDTYVNSGYTRE